jgi:hypothetical protein
MKTLKFNCYHTFKGQSRINIPGELNASRKYFLSGGNLIEIPLNSFQHGRFPIPPDWEIDKQFFVHQQGFEIKNQSLN